MEQFPKSMKSTLKIHTDKKHFKQKTNKKQTARFAEKVLVTD